MQKIYYSLKIPLFQLLTKGILLSLFILGFSDAFGQCAATVPTFTVDLSGNPDSTWNSVPTVRIDTCCGVVAPDRCVQFIVTLDSSAVGIVMDIPEGGGCGAKPTGSLFYQINCGPQVPIGTPVCLSGPGPHTVTFCKPGNNANCYQIQSIPEPDASENVVSTDGCAATMYVTGLDSSTISWTSVPVNATHNSYLDCLTCDTVTASATTGFPPFVDYQVCGFPIGGCAPSPFCDTIRVFFVSTIQVSIQPDSPTVCFGSGTTTIFANPNGGAAPYSYQWLTGGGNPIPGGSLDSLAVGPGTYIVEVTDTLGCNFSRDTVTVTAFSLPIQALAGNDTVICGRDTVPLNGAVQAASGGIWSRGTGTFIPNNQSLNGQYVPSAAEYSAGFVELLLTTTGNGTCPADSDLVRFTLSPRPQPIISGPDPVCENTSGHVYSTPAVAGDNYSWSVSGGTLLSGQGSNSISVAWGNTGSGQVSLTQSNPLGCDTTVIFTVQINPKPDPVIQNTPPFCEYSTGIPYSATPVVPGDTYIWSVTGGTLTGGQGTAAITVDWGAAGNGSVSLTQINAFGCDTSVTLNLVINPKPDPIINGPDSVCANTSGNGYSVSPIPGSTYQWTVNGGSIISGQGNSFINVAWGAAGSGTVSLTQTNAQGCDTTVSLNVIIEPTPVPIITGPDSLCQYSSGISYSVAPAAGHSYQWTVNGGSLVSGQGSNAIVVDWASPGNRQVAVYQVSPLGCDTTVVLPIFIQPRPNPTINLSPPFCEFSTQIPYSTQNIAGNTYLWTVNGGVIGSGQGTSAITVNWGPSGPGSVSLQVSNAFGCDTTITQSLTINPTPSPQIIGPDSLCQRSYGIGYSTTNVPGDSYVWTVNGGNLVSGQGTASISVNWVAAGNHSITLTQTNAFGCDSTVVLPVAVYPKPQPVIQGQPPFCANSQGVSFSVIGTTGNTYQWSVSGGSIASGQGSPNILVNWGNVGVGQISLTESTPFGCDTTVTLSVTLNPRPGPVLSGPDSVCAYQAAGPYSVPLVSGDSYYWQISGGTIASGLGTHSVTINWGASGSGLVTVTQTNAFGCDSTVSFPVTILPGPGSVISGPDPVCAYSSSQYSSPNHPGNAYVWSVNGGSITAGQGTPTITVVWNGPGTGTVTLSETTILGCDTAVGFPVNILAAPRPELSGPIDLCQNSSGNVYSTPPVTGVSYTWTLNGGTITSGQGSPSITVTWDSAGTGYVELYAVSPTGCDTTLSLPVNLRGAPVAIIQPGDTFACKELELLFDGSASPGAQFYYWNFGNGQTANSPQGIVYYDRPGQYNVTFIASHSNGCADTANAVINISPGPVAGFDLLPGFELNASNDSLIWSNLSQGGSYWFWDFGDGSGDSSYLPTYQYDSAGNYLITQYVEDSLGCRDSLSRPLTVNIDVTLFVPNVFSPNGDDLNEGFLVKYWNVRDFHVRIFDRWGAMIFESFDKDFVWDGTWRGQPCQEGAYVYHIIATGMDDREIQKVGTVTLIR